MDATATIINGVLWQRFEYAPDDVIWQRECMVEGCDLGLLYAPVRNCSACGGSGYFTQRQDPRVESGENR